MAIQEITEAVALDSTLQQVVSALDDIKEAVQPTNVCVDLDISIAASDWSNSSPYTYNWMNNKVTPECTVKVNFLNTSTDSKALYIGFEKITGGVQFTAPVKPTQEIAVRIHILNAEAESITAVSADMVSTSAISGAANVEQGLTSLNSKIDTYNFGSITLSEFESALNTFISAMGNGQYKYISVSISGELPLFGGECIGICTKVYTDRYNVQLFERGSIYPVIGVKKSDGWSWDKLALNSKITWTITAESVGIGIDHAISYPNTANEIIVYVAWYNDLYYTYTINIVEVGVTRFYTIGADDMSVVIKNDATERKIYVNSLKYNGQQRDTARFKLCYR